MACSQCEPRYTLMDKLSRRRPYIVHRAINNSVGNVVSLVEMKSQDDEGVPSEAIREIVALSRLRHPNVVRMLDVYANTDAKTISLAFELQCTNVEEYLRQHGKLEGMGLKRAAFQCAQGVAYIHSHGVSHRFLKITNVLIEATSARVMISDFSQAGCLRVSARRFRGQPPEQHLGAPMACGFSADVWALGTVIGEMALAMPLFRFERYQVGHLFDIFKVLGTPTESTWPGVSKLPHFSSHFPQWSGVSLDTFLRQKGSTLCEQGHQMLDTVLRLDPQARPCARAVLRHHFFYDLKTQLEVLEVVERCHTHGGPSSLSGPCAHMKKHGFSSNFAEAFHNDLGEFLGEVEFQPCVAHLRSKQSCDSSDHADGLTPLARQKNLKQCNLWSLHKLAQKQRISTEILLAGISKEMRAKFAEWCLLAFAVMQYPDKVLFDTVMLLDRCVVAKQEAMLAAQSAGTVRQEEVIEPQRAGKTEQPSRQTAVFGRNENDQTVVLATTLLSLKASFDPELWPESLPRSDYAGHINHLSRHGVEFQDVIAAELDIIKDLHSCLGAPTVLTLLDALGRRIAPTPQCRRLANFLLHLSVSDIDLQYGHPSLILAASAWLLAMYATHDDDDSMALLQIMAHGFLDTAWLCVQLRSCVVRLLEVWTCSRSLEGQSFCKSVCDKFQGRMVSVTDDDLSGQKFVAISNMNVLAGARSSDVLTTVQKDSVLEAMGFITCTESYKMLPVRTPHGLEGFVDASALNHVREDVLRLIPQWSWMRKWLEKRLDTIS